jgi:hypothetical protein
MSWDNSVYSTVKTTFNGRDQTTEVKQYQGADTSSVFQTTTATFDGHGRLKTGHRPEQLNANGTPASTTYNYNLNDSISAITDARGATTNYVYNDSRGLLTNINYSVPANSNIPVTPSVSFIYDSLGNRISMIDGIGSKSYEYNQLSQMTAETRQFNDPLTDGSVPANGFRLEYNYTLGGGLKSYKDPYNRQFDFGFDKTGRGTSVDGTAYAGVTSYSSNQLYRAFGSVKQITYGNQTTATMTYNNRLQPNSYRLMDGTQTLFGKDYFYTTGSNNDNDGLLKKSVHYDDRQSVNDRVRRNQVNTYDAQGRIKTSETGEAVTPFGAFIKNGPFQQSYSYDAFDNLTVKNDSDFADYVGCTNCPRWIHYSETIVNNRTQNSNYSVQNANTGQFISNYQYDNEGHQINRDGELKQYDTAGRMVFHDTTGTDDSYTFDSNGELTKWQQSGPELPINYQFYYYLRSSILGSNVLELDRTGKMEKEYVFSPTGAKLAYLKNNEVIWMHSEPSGKDSYDIKQDRTIFGVSTTDPTGVGTGNGFSGSGGGCSPSNCVNSANGPYNSFIHGFDDIHLQALIQVQRLSSQEFWTTTIVGYKQKGFRFGQEVTRYSDLNDRTIDYVFGAQTGNRNLHYLGAHIPINSFVFIPPPDDKEIGKDDIKKLRATVAKAVDEKTEDGKKCKDFLEKLLAKLGNSESNDILKLFDKINEKKGFYENDEIGHGDTKTTVNGSPPIIVLPSGQANDPEAGQLVVHEIVHSAGKTARYTHFEMAFAAKAVLDSKGVPPFRLSKKPKDPAGLKSNELGVADIENSQIFDDILKHFCKFGDTKK